MFLWISLASRSTYAKTPAEIIQSHSYTLNQPQKIQPGESLLRESKIIFLPQFVAAADFNPPSLFELGLNSIRKGMIFETAGERAGNLLIENPGFSKSHLARPDLASHTRMRSSAPAEAIRFSSGDKAIARTA